ncbi:MAG: TrkA family potassium uptake protein [Chloroflexota bacterium]|jgi:trk system potassium uptake protein TrkA
MRVIIVGSGRVGAGLASQLAEEGHEVVILDMRTQAFRRLRPGFSGQALRGDGTDTSVLERAGARECDWFLALTNGDNRNILAAQLAKQDFGIPHVLCKINDPVRAKAYATLGIDTINRTEMMIDSIGRHMGRPPLPGAGDVTVAVAPAPPVPPAAAEPMSPEAQAQMAAGEPMPAAPATPPRRVGGR